MGSKPQIENYQNRGDEYVLRDSPLERMMWQSCVQDSTKMQE